jgi:DNA-binding beta-propeller fold protein YncE
VCNGGVLVGNKKTNQIELWNAATGKVDRTWQLASTPRDMAYDAASDTAYAAVEARNEVATFHSNDPAVAPLVVASPALHFAIAADSTVFASLLDPTSPYSSSIAVLPPHGAAFSAIDGKRKGVLLGFDSPRSELVVAEESLSPSALRRFAYDPAQKTLKLTQERTDAGANGNSLAVSPDGKHIAFACGGGNGAGYSVFDHDSGDLDAKLGAWKVGAYPNGAAFSPDNRLLLTTNGERLFVYDVATHALVSELGFARDAACQSPGLTRVAFSPGGTIAFAIAKCLSPDGESRLIWLPLPRTRD